MSEPSMGWQAQLEALVHAHGLAARAFGDALRSLNRSDILTLGGEWTVRETAVHTIGTSKLYRYLLGGHSSPIAGRADLAVLNRAWFLMLEEDRPAVLADLVEASAAALTGDARKLDDNHRTALYFGHRYRPPGIVALGCDELLQHGWDIAVATGQPFECPGVAEQAVNHLGAGWCPLFRADLGEGATIAIRLQDAQPFAYRVRGGVLAFEPADEDLEYECTISGSAFRYLLWVFGRLDWDGSALRASGPRPELAQRFGFPR